MKQFDWIVYSLAVVLAAVSVAGGATFFEGGPVKLSAEEIERALEPEPAWLKEFGVERDWPVVLRGDEAIAVEVDPGGVRAKSGFTGRRWTGGVVYYKFRTNVNATNRQRFRNATEDWSSVADLTFIESVGTGAYIDVFSGTGNYSFIGMTGRPQELSMVSWPYQYIISHELGHALGLRHEQSRSDRDQYVQIYEQNVEPIHLHNFDRNFTTNYGAYDFDSVMHYPRNAFLKESLPSSSSTIRPQQAYLGFLYTMGNRQRLSLRDKLGMAARYGEPGGGGGGGNGQAQLADRGSEFNSISHATRYPGQKLGITGAVYNGGTGAAGSFTVSFYASANSSIASSDLFLGSTQVDSLAAGRFAWINSEVTVPYSLNDGLYYVGWIIDSGSRVSESDESDNAVVISGERLRVPASGNTELSDRGGAYHGLSDLQRSPLQKLVVSADVANTGTSTAAPFYVDFYASVNRTITTGDQFLGRGLFSGVEGESNAPVDTEVTIPETLAYGNYYIGFIIDSTNLVREVDESDNVAYILSPRLTVSESRIDLQDGGAAGQSLSSVSISAGEALALNAEIDNLGSTPAKGFEVSVHLSSDTNITTNDRLLGQVRVDGVAEGATFDLEMADLQIPTSQPPGEYYIGWIIDRDDEVQEFDEGNNTVVFKGGTQVVTISEPLPPATPGLVDASDGDFTNRVELDWENVAGATFYSVERATSAGGPYVLIASELFMSMYVDTTAVAGQSYYYRLLSWRSRGGFSEPSSPERGRRSVRVGTSYAGGGLPWPMPGMVEAEDFDSSAGGYSDSDAANTGGKYRLSEPVDIEGTADVGLGHNVTSTKSGEFTEYTIDVAEAGTYTLGLRVAAAAAGASVRVSVDGADLSGTLVVPSTGGAQRWVTLEVPGVSLEEGVQILRVSWISGGAKLNWVMVLPGEFAGFDADVDGDGLSALVEYQRGLDPAVSDSDGDGLSDGLELAFGSDPLDGGSMYDATLPCVSVNFTGMETSVATANELAAGDLAGVYPARFWRNVSGSEGGAFGLGDSAGGATSFGLAWYADETGSREAAGVAVPASADGAMLNGFLETGVDGVARIELSAVPYLSYDVIVYVDGVTDGGARHSSVVIEATGQDFWLADDRDWSGSYVQGLGGEVSESTAGANFVAFHGITMPSITIEVAAQGDGASVNGLQVIGRDPSTLALTEFEELPGAVRLAFRTDAGRTYRVVTSVDLRDWESVEGEEGIAGDGGVITRQFDTGGLPATAGRRYYRVLLE